METTGNPSSVHAEGRAARRIVEDARNEVARLAGVSSRCVTFVSGGTEAANAALNPQFGGGPNAPPLERLIVSAGEHACVLSGHRFPTAEVAPLAPDGRVDLDWLEAACRRPGRALVALQGANNETGVIQPVAEAAALVHAADGFLFCDAVQMAGRMSCDVAALGADALMLSAHKMGGLKGAGALVVARAGISLGAPLMRGGGQERGGRAGTESVATIAAFGAVKLRMGDQKRTRLLPNAALDFADVAWVDWDTPSPLTDARVDFAEARLSQSAADQRSSASPFPASRPRR